MANAFLFQTHKYFPWRKCKQGRWPQIVVGTKKVMLCFEKQKWLNNFLFLNAIGNHYYHEVMRVSSLRRIAFALSLSARFAYQCLYKIMLPIYVFVFLKKIQFPSQGPFINYVVKTGGRGGWPNDYEKLCRGEGGSAK